MKKTKRKREREEGRMDGRRHTSDELELIIIFSTQTWTAQKT